MSLEYLITISIYAFKVKNIFRACSTHSMEYARYIVVEIGVTFSLLDRDLLGKNFA